MISEKRVRFNIIDFFIIICLVASCFLFAYYAAGHVKKSAAAESDTLSYSIKITNISESSADLFVVGDNVSRTETSAPSGVITDVKKLSHTYLAVNSFGNEYVYRTDESRYDVTVTVQTGFSEDETSFIVGGKKLKVGQPIHAFTNRISFTGTVCDINAEN